jgi:hypothetical protein
MVTAAGATEIMPTTVVLMTSGWFIRPRQVDLTCTRRRPWR